MKHSSAKLSKENKIYHFFGGYYGAPEYEAELKREAEILHEPGKGKRESVSEIAVYIDSVSYLCVREHTLPSQDLSSHAVDELLPCGAPFELYNLSDLPGLDIIRYWKFVFLNACLLTNAQKEFIEKNLRGKTKVFAHAAAMWDGKSFSAERLSDMCGGLLRYHAPKETTIVFVRELS